MKQKNTKSTNITGRTIMKIKNGKHIGSTNTYDLHVWYQLCYSQLVKYVLMYKLNHYKVRKSSFINTRNIHHKIQSLCHENNAKFTNFRFNE